jgi:hypothetical protein
VLSAALVQVIEDLIARDPIRPRDRKRSVQFFDVEVADTP